MEKKILLNWMPPAQEYSASPALSVIKFYLSQKGFNADIKYWNLSLYSFLKGYLNFDNLIFRNELVKILPFYVHLAIKENDNQLLEDLIYYVLSQKPQLHAKGVEYIRNYFIENDKKLNKIIDEELSGINFNEYSYIAFSSQIYQWVVAAVMAKKVREINPDIPILIGGFGTRKEAMSFMNNFPDFNFASWGEGEVSTLLLTQFLSEQKNTIKIEDIPNMVYRSEEGPKFNNLRNSYVNLDELKLDISEYMEQVKNIELNQPIAIPIESARGCSWQRCHFCFLNAGYKYRVRSVDSLLSEMREKIEKYGVKSFLFLDNDTIGRDMDVYERMLDGFIELRNEYNDFTILMAEIITKGITYEAIKKMGIVHFQTVQIGYESPSANLLKKIDKKNTFASNFFFIKWGAQFGIFINGANIIRNLLEETDEDIHEAIANLYSFRFLLKDGSFFHSYSYLGINRSSRYFRILERENKLSEWAGTSMYMLPKGFVDDKDKYDLFFDFVKMSHNPLWDTFEKIEKHYINNNYEYSLSRNEHEIHYRERYNGLIINELEFDEKDIHWFILNHCNKQISSLSDILKAHPHGLTESEILNTIDELKSEGLVYCTTDYSEVVSVINPELTA